MSTRIVLYGDYYFTRQVLQFVVHVPLEHRFLLGDVVVSEASLLQISRE